MAGISKTILCMLIRLRTFWGFFCSSVSRNMNERQVFPWFYIVVIIIIIIVIIALFIP